MNKRFALLTLVFLVTFALAGCGGNDQPAPAQEAPAQNEAAPAENTAEEQVPAEEAPTEEPPAAEAPASTDEPVAEDNSEMTTFSNEVFTIMHPPEWYGDALAGLGFFATDQSLQTTWYGENGTPNVPSGAAMIVLAGTREDMSVGPDDTPIDVINEGEEDWGEGCVLTGEPQETTINGNTAAVVTLDCVTSDGVATKIVSALIVTGDKAAGLTAIMAAEEESTYLPILIEMMNSFQFTQ